MNSLTARFALAVQAQKGTGATTGFHAMRLSRSQLMPTFEYEDALNEHSGVHQRASTRTSTPDRISKLANVSGTGLLYPAGIGVLLTGMGFNDTTTDNTTYKTHAFTKANADAAKWLSAMQAVGTGAGRFERKAIDVRLTSLTLAASRQNIQVTFEGMGLDVVESAGTETVTSEPNVRLLPTAGTLTWGSQALGIPREHTITIARPVEQDDQKLHSFGRAGADETGFEVTGQMRGLDLSETLYNKLVYGGASGTAMSEVCVTDGLTFSFESAVNINGASVPYRIEFDIAKADIRFTNFEAQGNNIVRADVDWYMIDDASTAPITVEVDNGVTAY